MGLSAAECFFCTTQSQRGYGAIDPSVPIVNEEEKMGMETAKLSAELLCHSELLNQH